MPSQGIAPVPGGVPLSGHAGAGPVPVSGVFPAGWHLRLLETRVQAIRLSPYRADLPARRPYASARPPVSWHAIVPFTFRITGQPSDPGISSKFLPVEPGIQQGASRRSQTCQFACGCDQPAASCEPHHVTHRADGGHTSLTNLKDYCWLCRYRHNQHYADLLVMPMPGGPALVSGGARAGEAGIIYRFSRKARSGSGGR